MELNSSEVRVKSENISLKLTCETDGNEEVINYLSQECTVDQTRLVETDCGDISTVTLPVSSVAGTFIEHGSLQLSDGSTAYIESITNQLDDGHNVAVQLEDGTTAFIRTTHKDGLQAVQLQDGTTAYISQTLDLEEFTTGVLDGVESVDLTNISLGKSQPSSSSVRSGTTRTTKAVSLGEKAFRCPHEGCERLYTTQHHLKVHERTHTGDRPFKCVSCKKAFATGYSLKSHTRVHTGEKPYKCNEEYCGKAFKTSGDLQKHLRTHTGERPFKCPYQGCDRSFTTSNIRKVHMRIHTGERPYICPREGCDRTFASATNYKNHLRIHTGEKPYVCGIKGCGKKFTEYSSLYKHHVVHTSTKPYVCDLCGRNYRQTSTLAMHKRSAHGITETIEITDVHTEDVTSEQSETEENNQIHIDSCHSIEVTVVDSNGETLEVSKSENMVEQPVQLQLSTGESSDDILPDTPPYTAIQVNVASKH